jgi:hypothetical protein
MKNQFLDKPRWPRPVGVSNQQIQQMLDAARMSYLEGRLSDTSIRAPYSDERAEMRKELAQLRKLSA